MGLPRLWRLVCVDAWGGSYPRDRFVDFGRIASSRSSRTCAREPGAVCTQAARHAAGLARPLRQRLDCPAHRLRHGRVRRPSRSDQGAVHRRPVRPPGRRGELVHATGDRPPARCSSSTARSTSGQRKLLLPPFQGPRVATFRSVIREVAEREASSWRPGTRIVVRERTQTLTFEVICRAVFGGPTKNGVSAHVAMRT